MQILSISIMQRCKKISTHPTMRLSGQTVHHQPEAGRSIQLGDGKRLARLCGLPVIYDFRRADMEAGGQARR